MDRENAVHFLKLLGAKNIRPAGVWVRCSCPLAAALHPSGKDDNPSFGIKASGYKESFYHCFTCGSGSLFQLAVRLTWLRRLPEKAKDFLMLQEIQEDHHDLDRTGYQDPFAFFDDYVPEQPCAVPDMILFQFPALHGASGYEAKRCREWLTDRGISEDIIKEFDLRYYKTRQLILFPVKDLDHLTYKLHVRSRIEKLFYHLTPEILESDIPWGRKDSWFGMQFYDKNVPVILVESETDLLRLGFFGVRDVLASCGPISREKMARITSPHVTLGFDADEPGRKFTRKAIQFLPEYTYVVVLDWSIVNKRGDPSRPAKDAGDLASARDLQTVLDAGKGFLKGGDSNVDINFKDRYAKYTNADIIESLV